MPFIYVSHNKQAPLSSWQTNNAANTQNDFFFLKPGASRPTTICGGRSQGKAAAATNLNGVAIRIGMWTTTASASTAATSTTPSPKNKLAPAAVSTAGMATSASSTVTSGTGGPLYVGTVSCGGSGPGAWQPYNIDDIPLLDGNANMSLDAFNESGGTNVPFELEIDNQEC